MREPIVRGGGLALTVAYAALIGWIYVRQPASAAQVTGGLASLVNAYHVDPQAFDDGLRFFHADQFAAARSAFGRADPAERDARTQFYIAYSCYREGWGRLYNDRALFQQGLVAVDRAIAAAPSGRIVVEDPQLGMHSADELRAELNEGLAHAVHPERVLGGRK